MDRGDCVVGCDDRDELFLAKNGLFCKQYRSFLGIKTHKEVIHLTEKELIERNTADGFLKLYNAKMNSSYEIIEHSDAPDFLCRDKDGEELKLEITLTEDQPGDIQALLSRSEKRSAEELERHLEAHERGEESIFESGVSCLNDNVSQMVALRIQPKLSKDYGTNAALVVRDSSPLDWDWNLVADQVNIMLNLKRNPFDKGIWIISYSKDKIFKIL